MGQYDQNIIREAFNIVTPIYTAAAVAYNIQQSKQQQPPAPLTINQTATTSSITQQSGNIYLGLNKYVADALQVRWPQFTIGNKIIPAGVLSFDCVLINVSQAKKIVKTDIQGRDGSVKEYIGKDDYQINIKGVIAGLNGVQPLQQISDLNKFLDVPVTCDVVSVHLQNLGINSIVVNDWEMPQSEGSISYQAFTINCLSDTPQELRIINV